MALLSTALDSSSALLTELWWKVCSELCEGSVHDAGRLCCRFSADDIVTEQRHHRNLLSRCDWLYRIPGSNLEFYLPTASDSNGGTEVMIQGVGFERLFPGNSEDYLMRTRNMRCSFGGQVQPILPSWHNDTHIICITTWGDESDSGQLVGIGLNGQSFSTNNDVRFDFKGLHKPALVEVYFPPEATSLVVRVDEQPSNRAGMVGIQDCSTLLQDSTVAVLKGTSEDEPKCFWSDDSTMVAYLSMFTAAGPGMTVKIKPNVLWPKTWKYPGGCNVPESMCAGAGGEKVEMSVNPFFPCDRVDTAEREACIQPVALIQGPDKISSCPDTAMDLDGSRSTGGGIKALTYTWSVHPTKSDNAYQITAGLIPQGNTEVAKLKSELNGGNTFVFLLKVSNFLGSSSTEYEFKALRDALPIPTISIEAPPLFTFRRPPRFPCRPKQRLLRVSAQVARPPPSAFGGVK